MESWEPHIEPQRESGGLLGVEYLTTEGVWWAHSSSILCYGRSSVESWEFNIDPSRNYGKTPVG